MDSAVDDADPCGQVDFGAPGHFNFGATRQGGSVFTHVSSNVASSGKNQCQVELQISCYPFAGHPIVSIGNLVWSDDRHVVLALKIDDQPWDTLELRLDPVSIPGKGIAAGNAQLDQPWYERLKSGEQLTVDLLNANTGTVTFDLVEVFSTPVQPTLDDCGNVQPKAATEDS